MVGESKFREWAEAISKVLHQDSDDKVVSNFAEYVDKKARMLENSDRMKISIQNRGEENATVRALVGRGIPRSAIKLEQGWFGNKLCLPDKYNALAKETMRWLSDTQAQMDRKQDELEAANKGFEDREE